MPLGYLGTQARQYVFIGLMLLGSWYMSTHFTQRIDNVLLDGASHGATLFVLFSIVIVIALGYVISELAKPTIIPSFVLAILFGIVSRDILSLLIQNPLALSTLITIGAILILFEGGIDTPFTKFRRLLGPIVSLAFIGTLFNALLLALLLVSLSQWTGIALPLPAAILLAAAIASTDPAAIIPCFQDLQFRKPRVKHIAISESAINDVVSAVLVTIFLSVFLSGVQPQNVLEAYGILLNWQSLVIIGNVLLRGAVVGLIGFGILHLWSRWKQQGIIAEGGSDAALFLAVPLFAFTLAEAIGGSGFLAVFLVGLLFHMQVHFRHVEHYFTDTVEGFMKPMIFMLLGALVEPAQLVAVAPLGIAVGLLFMFVLRPLTVLVTLTPFGYGRQKLTIRELAFLSFVRETGVIPAALLITISAAGIPGSQTMLAVGLWVILLTLIILPPLTPILARRLGVAQEKSPLPNRMHHGPVAVLCSRGFSFAERLDTVVDWALEHSVENIALLHCPEERYTKEFVQDVGSRAHDLFKSINHTLENEGKKPLNFEFLCGPGLLQDNIESLIAAGDVSIIFIGSKMLDYRLEDVKRLQVPFFFMT